MPYVYYCNAKLIDFADRNLGEIANDYEYWSLPVLIFDDISLKIGRLFYFLNADYKLVIRKRGFDQFSV